MEEAIIGRKAEKLILKRALRSENPEFLALYGRRRVGKTFLITEYFEGKGILFEAVGAIDAPREIQLARFGIELANTFSTIEKDTIPGSWDEAMRILVLAVDEVLHSRPEEKIILFFDEIPWFDSGKSGFLSALDYTWNRHFSKSRYGNVLIVICGSAASWMIKKVINNKGGLHNRVTETIRLAPFDLGETKRYLESRNVFLENRQIIELYMAFGGIPAYLSLVRPGLSSSQVINQLCFTSGKYLTEEFDRLFGSLFAKHQNHVRIVRTLASAPKGLARMEIVKKSGLPGGGDTSLYLKELEESGFIASIPLYAKKTRGRFYRLSDEYSLFYLKWIEPAALNTSGVIDENFWLRQSERPAWAAWAGYAFEGVCLKHVSRIKHALGISGVATREAGWRCSGDRNNDKRGAQVDLVIDRADRTVNLCELKFVKGEFEITADYRRVLTHKKEMFRMRTGTRSLVLLTLITSYGARENGNFVSVVDNQFTMDCLF
jgi:uncharacterized protein